MSILIAKAGRILQGISLNLISISTVKTIHKSWQRPMSIIENTMSYPHEHAVQEL